MSKQLHVLLVCYAFPPAGGVGVLRAASLARYLPAEQIRLDVLTTRNPSAVGADPTLLDGISGEVTIHRTFTLDIPFRIKKSIKRWITGGKPVGGAAKDGSGNSGRNSGKRLLKRLVQELLMPDPQVTWLPILKRAARRIVKERNIDLVLITVPPFSSLLLVKYLRKQYRQLPIVIDMRDEWLSTSIELFGFSQSRRARAIAARAEAAAVRDATAVVMVTDAARREMRARYPDQPASKFEHVPNGFDATRVPVPEPVPEPAWEQPDTSKIVIAYVGSVYRTSDPTGLVEALQSLPEAIAQRFCLRFIGYIEEQRFRQSLLRLGGMVDGTVELTGYLPQREALAAMAAADYALLISHDPLNAGAKFYDYIGSGKPILAVIHPDGELRHLFEHLRAGWWASDRDPGAILQLFLDAADRGKPPFHDFRPNLEAIVQYERKPLAQRFAALLHSIAAGAGPGQAEEREFRGGERTSA